MKVFWTTEAEETFNQNISYLEEEWNAAVIENFIYKTEEAINAIAQHPFIFPSINKRKQIHKCLVVKQVSVYYQILENRIDLLTFWNNYQNPKKLKL